jgi:hypothetical protein
MSDWIQRLAEGEAAQTERQRLQSELRLHNARIIRAKMPEFWDAVLEQLRADSARLAQVFSGDRGRQCQLIEIGTGCQLQGCKLPWRILDMRLNVEGLSVDIVESIRESRDRTIRSGRDQIKITVNTGEELELIYRSTRHTTPESLAQHLISHVLGLHLGGISRK